MRRFSIAPLSVAALFALLSSCAGEGDPEGDAIDTATPLITTSPSPSRLAEVQVLGSDAQLDALGAVIDTGMALPPYENQYALESVSNEIRTRTEPMTFGGAATPGSATGRTDMRRLTPNPMDLSRRVQQFWLDLNGDTHIDFVYVERTAYDSGGNIGRVMMVTLTINTLIANGRGGFQRSTHVTKYPHLSWSIRGVVADIDQDGLSEVVLISSTTGRESREFGVNAWRVHWNETQQAVEVRNGANGLPFPERFDQWVKRFRDAPADTTVNVGPVIADMDGDGRADLVRVSNTLDGAQPDGGVYPLVIHTAVNAGQGQWDVAAGVEVDVDWLMTGWEFVNPMPYDVNNDGRTDLVMRARSQRWNQVLPFPPGTTESVVVLLSRTSNLANFLARPYEIVKTPIEYDRTYQLGDFNGDGLIDLLTRSKGAGGRHTMLQLWAGVGDGSFARQAERDEPALSALLNSGTWRTADMNGDGRHDLLRIRKDGNNILLDLIETLGQRGGLDVHFGIHAPQSLGTGELIASDINDADGDGRLDAVILVQTGLARIYEDESSCADRFCHWTRHDLESRIYPLPIAAPVRYEAVRQFLPADVDGDGILDRVRVRRIGAKLLQIDTAFGSAAGGFRDEVTAPLGVPVEAALRGPEAPHVFDANGDGRSDLIFRRAFDAGGGNRSLGLQVALSLGNGTWSTGGEWTSPADRSTATWPQSLLWHEADVTGDGRKELVHMATSIPVPVVTVAQFQDDGTWRLTQSAITHDIVKRYAHRWAVMDAEGDGREDLVAVIEGDDDTNDIVTLRFAEDGSLLSLRTQSVAQTHRHLPGAWAPIDLQGDGLSDLVALGTKEVAKRTNVQLELLANHGLGFRREILQVSTGEPSANRHQWRFGDDNADGTVDLLQLGFDRGALTVAVYAATPFADALVQFASPVRRVFPDVASFPLLAPWSVTDVDADGSIDLERLQLNTRFENQRLYRSVRLPLLVEHVTPLGGASLVSYERASVQEQLNDPASGCRLPPGTTYVVSSETTDARDGSPNTTATLDYACPGYDAERQEARGWTEVRTATSPSIHREPSAMSVTYSATRACGVRPEWSVTTGPRGQSVSAHTEYSAPLADAPYRCAPSATERTEIDGRGQRRTVRNETLYDNYGRIARRLELGDSNPLDDRWVDYGHDLHGDLFISTLASMEGFGAESPFAPLWRKRFCYDTSPRVACSAQAQTFGELTGVLTYSEEHGRDLVEEFLYDGLGNRVGTRDAMGRESEVAYDSFHQTFPEHSWNALRHHTQTEWHPLFGTPTRVVDGSNRVELEVRTYDALGRLETLRDANGASQQTQYVDMGDPRKQLVRVTELATGIWVETTMDGLGRVRRTTEQGQHANEVVETTYADASSLVHTVTHPHAAGTRNPPFQTLSYDYLGRAIRTLHPDGTASRTEYRADRTIATDEVGISVERLTDAHGRVAQLLEPHLGAQIATTYSYNAADFITQVVDPAGNVTLRTWNVLGPNAGWLMHEDDPDVGRRLFEHDEVGNVGFSRDARGEGTRIEYDDLNRPTVSTILGSGRILEWKYDEGGHGGSIGQLTRILDSDAGGACGSVSDDIQYDRLGRVQEYSRCWDGFSATMGTTYDAIGRVQELVYGQLSDRRAERVTYTYDRIGRLRSIGSYISNIDYGLDGVPERIDFANGAHEVYRHDPERRWLDGIEVYDGASAMLFQETLVHRPNGLIEEQASCGVAGTDCTRPGDLIRSTYDYDGQYRLTSMSRRTPTGPFDQRFEYDEAGNMVLHSDVGPYTYPAYGFGARHVHGADSAGSRSFEYDDAGNLEFEFEGHSLVRSFNWDGYGHLRRVDAHDVSRPGTALTTEYDYDASGTLVQMRTGRDRRTFLFPEMEIDEAGLVTKSYHLDGRRIASRDPGGTVTFLHSDHIGSTSIATNDVASVPAGGSYGYDAFGRLLTGDPDIATDYQFTGQRQDRTTALLDPLAGTPDFGDGLVHMGARFYDPTTARFISPDPLPVRNRYNYAFSNPISFRDPTGYSPEGLTDEEAIAQAETLVIYERAGDRYVEVEDIPERPFEGFLPSLYASGDMWDQGWAQIGYGLQPGLNDYQRVGALAGGVGDIAGSLSYAGVTILEGAGMASLGKLLGRAVASRLSAAMARPSIGVTDQIARASERVAGNKTLGTCGTAAVLNGVAGREAGYTIRVVIMDLGTPRPDGWHKFVGHAVAELTDGMGTSSYLSWGRAFDSLDAMRRYYHPAAEMRGVLFRSLESYARGHTYYAPRLVGGGGVFPMWE